MKYEPLKGGDRVRMFDRREPFGTVYRIEKRYRRKRDGDDAIYVLDANGDLRYTSRWVLKRMPSSRLTA